MAHEFQVLKNTDFCAVKGLENQEKIEGKFLTNFRGNSPYLLVPTKMLILSDILSHSYRCKIRACKVAKTEI